MGDHHLTANHYVQVLPTMASLSPLSGNMRLLPFYNPILLAEQLATLDVITGGRTTVINALRYDPEAFIAFQRTQSARVSRFVETFEIMKLLWESDEVTYQGRHYSIDAPVGMNPKPVSKPLTMWVAGSADPPICRAAKMADGWVIAPGSTLEVARAGSETYKQALENYGRDVGDMSIVLRRDAHLHSASASAHREAQTLFENGYRGFGSAELETSLVIGGPA